MAPLRRTCSTTDDTSHSTACARFQSTLGRTCAGATVGVGLGSWVWLWVLGLGLGSGLRPPMAAVGRGAAPRAPAYTHTMCMHMHAHTRICRTSRHFWRSTERSMGRSSRVSATMSCMMRTCGGGEGRGEG